MLRQFSCSISPILSYCFILRSSSRFFSSFTPTYPWSYVSSSTRSSWSVLMRTKSIIQWKAIALQFMVISTPSVFSTFLITFAKWGMLLFLQTQALESITSRGSLSLDFLIKILTKLKSNGACLPIVGVFLEPALGSCSVEVAGAESKS